MGLCCSDCVQPEENDDPLLPSPTLNPDTSQSNQQPATHGSFSVDKILTTQTQHHEASSKSRHPTMQPTEAATQGGTAAGAEFIATDLF